MTLFLRNADLVGLMPFEDYVTAVEDGYRECGLGRGSNLPRTNLWIEGDEPPATRGGHLRAGSRGSFKYKGAFLPGIGGAGIQAYTAGLPAGLQTFLFLFDTTSGALSAVMEVLYYDWVKTAAVAAVATRHLAPEGARVAALIGTGRHARSQLHALVQAAGIERVQVYGRDRARLDAFDAARGTLRPRRPAFPAGRHVALIPIEGLIFDGESRRTPVPLPIPLPLVGEARSGDLTVVQAIRRAQRDARVGAVVVYVDSPGGSPFASEAMLGALIALNEHKPVVVAMGAVAASGGYYVAVPGRRVFAQPSTITGSIGVVSAKIVTRGLLDRFALRRETLHRGRHALLASPERAYTPEERALVWAHIGRTYDLFLDRVASGRGMTTAEVDAVGGGRVWTGRQALEHGLVDELGGLPAALAYARRLAGIRGDAPPLVIAGGGRQWLPPLVEAVPNGAGAVAYALDALAMLGSGAPLLISPLVRTDRR